jgi:cytoskeletal protein RodZ
MGKTQLIAAILLLIVGALFVVACGGDDDDAANPTATSDQSGSTANATAEPGDTSDAPTATAASSDPTEEPDDGGTVADACALVTKEEAEAALGSALQAPYITYSGTANVGLTSAQATVSTCAYMSEAGVPSANITYWSSPGHATEIKAMVAEGVNGACVNKEMIDGLGDVACWYDSQHAEIQLATGATFLDIFVTMEGDASDALLDIAEKAVGRLS